MEKSNFRTPIATYRLQFNSQFRFSDALPVIPYLAQLGISDVYSSPVFKTRKGSLSGYDVTDPGTINPELGTEAEFESFCREINKHSLGLLLDIVPNHMAVNAENPFWRDVLKKGRFSRYADFFDIDWKPLNGRIENKVILPILAKPYNQALVSGEIHIEIDDGSIGVVYNSIYFPVSLKSCAWILSQRLDELEKKWGADYSAVKELKQVIHNLEILPEVNLNETSRSTQIDWEGAEEGLQKILLTPEIRGHVSETLDRLNGEKGSPSSFNKLHDILEQQPYRLVFWKTGRNKINFRRFFDVNDLIGIRVDLPEVLEETHARVFREVREGRVTGLRIDHIDGLYDPKAYLHELNRRLNRFYIVVEKILAEDEALPGDWPVHGTTGYEFAREVNALFIDREGITRLDKHYSKMTGCNADFASVIYEKKKQVMEELFAAEISNLGVNLGKLAENDRTGRDFSTVDLIKVMVEVTACLPVYRTYTNSFEISPVDRWYIETAVKGARQRNPALDEPLLEFFRKVLLLEFSEYTEKERKQHWLQWVMKWQQFTGPVTAKGLEDTALYNYNRLMSLNTLGTFIQPVEGSVDRFHFFNTVRQAHWPLTLNATSTHDTKRSEDVNARINVLCEMTRSWLLHLSWWRRSNHSKKQEIQGLEVPEPNTEELLYQTLLGAWPLNEGEIPEFKKRFKQYMLKAVREAKVFTSWIHPNEKYEKGIMDFIDGIFDESGQSDFLLDFIAFQKEVAFFGALNSLGQVLLKIASPGVPDFYQGTELWELSLVDPDNRRPVNYELRSELLSEIIREENEDRVALIRDILKHWQDGRVKLYLIYKALQFRRQKPELFQRGEYLPLRIEGKKANNLVAFARRSGEEWIILAVPRLLTELVEVWDFPTGKHVWGRDLLILPENCPGNWRNVITHEVLGLSEREEGLLLADVFNSFPVALLENTG